MIKAGFFPSIFQSNEVSVLATRKGDRLIFWVFLAWTIILDSWIIFHWFDSNPLQSLFFLMLKLPQLWLLCPSDSTPGVLLSFLAST